MVKIRGLHTFPQCLVGLPSSHSLLEFWSIPLDRCTNSLHDWYHAQKFNLLPLNHFITTLAVRFGVKPVWAQVLTSRLMSLDVASMFLHNVLSLWCNLVYKVHQFLLKQKEKPKTWCCHCHHLVRMIQASQFVLQMQWQSLCPNSYTLVSSNHMTCLQKWRYLSLCASANWNLAF